MLNSVAQKLSALRNLVAIITPSSTGGRDSQMHTVNFNGIESNFRFSLGGNHFAGTFSYSSSLISPSGEKKAI